MGNQFSSSGMTEKLVLVGIWIAAAVSAWKFFKRSKRFKEERKKLQFFIFLAFVVFVVIIVFVGLCVVASLDDETTDETQIIPNQSTSISFLHNLLKGAFQLLRGPIRKEIKIMTYNLCHSKKNSLYARVVALSHLVQEHMPDVVLFQEATSNMHEILKNFLACSSYNCVSEGSNYIVFSKLSTEYQRSVLFNEGGLLVLTKTKFNTGNNLFIATSHLKCSTHNSTTASKDAIERMSQAEYAIEYLHCYPNIIFGGDMNWRNNCDDFFPLKPGWVDAWEHIRPYEPGYTFDTKNNPMLKGRKTLRKRFDRFLCKLNDFELVDIKIIGKEEIPVLVPCCKSADEFENQSVIVSDHYGLILTVRAI